MQCTLAAAYRVCGCKYGRICKIFICQDAQAADHALPQAVVSIILQAISKWFLRSLHHAGKQQQHFVLELVGQHLHVCCSTDRSLHGCSP